MPVNRNALIRYRTIDKCLQNKGRKWSIEDLIDACSVAIYDYEGIDKGISLRTIRMDLSAMRSEKLGYNAPIIVKDNKYYTYEDKNYSISNSPMSKEDINVLQEASMLLKQFKGFAHFNDLNELIQKLEDKIYTKKFNTDSVIDFEKNDLLIGIHWLDYLYKSIINREVLNLKYKSFKSRTENDYIIYPYLLKEYRNRWFLLAKFKKSNQLMTFALDRIQDITIATNEIFVPNNEFDLSTFYKPVIGVTRDLYTKPTVITFIANHYHSPYIVTKPIHWSQTLIEKKVEGCVFTIEIIPNFEFEKEILGFGEGIKVIAPSHLVGRFKRNVRLMYENYFDKK
jgi:predicted DNA-binding transcriptional regulator YafY